VADRVDGEEGRFAGVVPLGARVMMLGSGGVLLLSPGEAAFDAGDTAAASGFGTSGEDGRRAEPEASRA
jgi:hypothetical protein